MKSNAIEISTGDVVTIEAPCGRLPAGYRALTDRDRARQRGAVMRSEIKKLEDRGDVVLAEQERRTLADAIATGIAS